MFLGLSVVPFVRSFGQIAYSYRDISCFLRFILLEQF